MLKAPLDLDKYEDTYLYKEWAPTVQSRAGVMLPLSDFNGSLLQYPQPGYSSLYAFPKEAAEEIRSSKSSKGLDKYPVYADTLVLDIDSGLQGLNKVLPHLTGLDYQVWESGGKGYHVYIRHFPMLSVHLPWSHSVAVRKLLKEDVGVVDLSIYRAGGLLSLPNRLHEGTGRRKTFISRVKGQPLEIQLVERPERPKFTASETNNAELEAAFNNTLESLYSPPTEGNRHTLLWGLARDFSRAGISYDATLQIIQKVNESWHSPKPPSLVERAVQQAYQIQR